MKRLFFILALITVTMTASAQYSGNKLTDNVSVGVQAGVTTPLDFNGTFPLNPTANVFLQKGITPNLAFRVNGGLLFGENHLDWSQTTVKAVNVGGDAVLNWGNIINGYKGEPRTIEFSTVTGLGWAHYYIDGVDANGNNFLTAKTGLDIALNVGKAKALQFVLEPQVIWNLTQNADNMPKFDKRFAQLGLTAGVVYKFKTSNGTHNFVKVRPYDYAEVERLNEQIKQISNSNKQLRSRNEHLTKELIAEKAKPKTVIKQENTNTMVNPAYILFEKSKYELNEDAKVTLNAIKTDKSVVVTGYASPEGTEEFNQNLSFQRAKAVADYLQSKGVKVSDIVGAGVAGQASNRVVVITQTK